jgi:hypothetical protein
MKILLKKKGKLAYNITLFTECIAYTCDYQRLYTLSRVVEEEDENDEEETYEILTDKEVQQNPNPPSKKSA